MAAEYFHASFDGGAGGCGGVLRKQGQRHNAPDISIDQLAHGVGHGGLAISHAQGNDVVVAKLLGKGITQVLTVKQQR